MKKYLIIGLIITVLMIAGCTPAGKGPVCGDGDCNVGENSENCAADCSAALPVETKPIVFIEPDTKSVIQGESFTLEVKAKNVEDLYGFQFDVTYAPSVIEFVDLKEGGFLSNNGQTQLYCMDHTLTEGLIKNIVCAKLGGEGVSGDGLLVTLNFKGLLSGQVDVSLENVKLARSDAEKMDITVANAKITVE